MLENNIMDKMTYRKSSFPSSYHTVHITDTAPLVTQLASPTLDLLWSLSSHALIVDHFKDLAKGKMSM